MVELIERLNLPDEEDADTCIVLSADEPEVVFEIVQSCLGDGVAVEVVLRALVRLIFGTIEV